MQTQQQVFTSKLPGYEYNNYYIADGKIYKDFRYGDLKPNPVYILFQDVPEDVKPLISAAATPPPFKLSTIEKVKKGDYFRFPGRKPVYVADGYNRHTRKYSAHKFDDVNTFAERKRGCVVEIDFEF